MKSKALTLILYTFLVLFSCSEDDVISETQNPPDDPHQDQPPGEEPDKPKTYPKATLDISDAVSLIGLEDVTGGRVASEKTNLFKITDDGKFETVEFVYPDGSPIDSAIALMPSLKVFQLYHVNPEYLLLTGLFTFPDTLGNTQQRDIILARKTDGAIFGFERGLYLTSGNGDPAFKHDDAGNVYCMTNERNVAKISLDNPEQLTRILYLATGQQANRFEILPDGACVYEKSGVDRVFRVRKVNGGTFDIVVPDQANSAFWTASNGQVYFATHSGNPWRGMIHKVTTGNNDVIVETVASVSDYQTEVAIANMHDRTFRIHTERSTIFVSDQEPDYSFEFFHDDNTIRLITLPFVKTGCTIAASKSNYYVTVDNSIYQVDISTHSYNKILNSGEFEIYSMTVDEADVIQFSGLRFSDGKKILAEIKNGVLTVIEEEMNRTAVILERLY